MSGPLLDRVDLQVDVRAVPWREIRDGARGESSARVRARVDEARARAAARSDRREPAGRLTVREIREQCPVDGEAEGLLERAVDGGRLSVRGCHRVLRVARTVADLAAADRIAGEHVAEAIGYRVLDDGAGEG